MSIIEVMLDARDLMGVYEIEDYAQASLMEVMKLGTVKMEQDARSNHRFQSRTGSLVEAILSETWGLSGRVYIDDFIAPYGVYVHEGQRSWAPDQFIYKAVSKNLSSLKMALHREYAKAKAKYSTEHAIFEKEQAIEIIPGVEFKPNYKTPKIPTPVKLPTAPVKPIPSPVKLPPKALPKKLPAPKNKVGVRVSIIKNLPVVGKKDYSLDIKLFESLRKEEIQSEMFQVEQELKRINAVRRTNGRN